MHLEGDDDRLQRLGRILDTLGESAEIEVCEILLRWKKRQSDPVDRTGFGNEAALQGETKGTYLQMTQHRQHGILRANGGSQRECNHHKRYGTHYGMRHVNRFRVIHTVDKQRKVQLPELLRVWILHRGHKTSCEDVDVEVLQAHVFRGVHHHSAQSLCLHEVSEDV